VTWFEVKRRGRRRITHLGNALPLTSVAYELRGIGQVRIQLSDGGRHDLFWAKPMAET
jgi:hypothetical protein